MKLVFHTLWRFTVFLLALLLIGMAGALSISESISIGGDGSFQTYTDFARVRDYANGASGSHSYVLEAEIVENSTTLYSEYSLNSTVRKLSNRYSISARNPEACTRLSLSSRNLIGFSTDNVIESTNLSFASDLNASGDGDFAYLVLNSQNGTLGEKRASGSGYFEISSATYESAPPAGPLDEDWLSCLGMATCWGDDCDGLETEATRSEGQICETC